MSSDSASNNSESSDNDDSESSERSPRIESLNDKLTAHNEIPISTQSDIPPTPDPSSSTALPSATPSSSNTSTTAVLEDKKTKEQPQRGGQRRRQKAKVTRQELNPKYTQLSSVRRITGGGFGAGFIAPNKKSTKKKKISRLEAAKAKNNGLDYRNLQAYKGFGAKKDATSVEFQPINKDYEEIATLLELRGGVRPGPGHYADGLSKLYTFAGTKNPTLKKPTGPRYEQEIGSKVKRKPRFDDAKWKMQHLLAGSLHRAKTKNRMHNSNSRNSNSNSSSSSSRKSNRQEDGKELETDTEAGSGSESQVLTTPQQRQRRARPSTAGRARRGEMTSSSSSPSASFATGATSRFRAKHHHHLERSKSYAAFENKRLPVSFGPGFGRPLRTPMQRWKLKHTNNIETIGKGKKYVDPAMVPRIQRGSCITPITTLSKKQLQMLQRAQRIHAGLEPRPKKIGPRGVGAPLKKAKVKKKDEVANLLKKNAEKVKKEVKTMDDSEVKRGKEKQEEKEKEDAVDEDEDGSDHGEDNDSESEDD